MCKNPDDWTRYCPDCFDRAPMTDRDYEKLDRLMTQMAAQHSARVN